MDCSILDVMSDCYLARCIGSYKMEQYYSELHNKVYEITYDYKTFEIMEINIRDAESEDASKKGFYEDIEDYIPNC